jgi:hypothetical protein
MTRFAAPALLTALLLATACSESVAAAEKTKVPLLGKTLAFTLPTGFVRSTDENNGTNVLIEYLPAGENFENWTRLVTIQAYRGLGQDPRPTAEIARAAFYPAACKVGPIYLDLGEKTVAPGLKRTLVVDGCASLPDGAYPQALKGAGEQDFLMIFRDGETIYTLNYAERGEPFKGKSPPRPNANAEKILAEVFGPVTLG